MRHIYYMSSIEGFLKKSLFFYLYYWAMFDMSKKCQRRDVGYRGVEAGDILALHHVRLWYSSMRTNYEASGFGADGVWLNVYAWDYLTKGCPVRS
jgi:hypothetical protein